MRAKGRRLRFTEWVAYAALVIAVAAVAFLRRHVGIALTTTCIGMIFDIAGAIIMSVGLFARRAAELASRRTEYGLDNPGFSGWIRKSPAVIASRIGSQYSKTAEQEATEDVGDVFMGLAFIIVGFMLQMLGLFVAVSR